MDVYKIQQNFRLISALFPDNSNRKNYFLATCKFIDNEIDLVDVDQSVPFGGNIGIDDSILEQIFKGFKLFRMHAVLHDAAGFVRSKSGKGPGYCYVLNRFPFNWCLIGHIPGFIFCLLVKFKHATIYSNMEL